MSPLVTWKTQVSVGRTVLKIEILGGSYLISHLEIRELTCVLTLSPGAMCSEDRKTGQKPIDYTVKVRLSQHSTANFLSNEV